MSINRNLRIKNEPENVDEWFAYNPLTGIITNKLQRGKALTGHPVGHLDPAGYLRIDFFGVRILCHRLAWRLHHGEWPRLWVDHINRNKSDNRVSNLRLADGHQNAQNRKVNASSRTGLKGVGVTSYGRYRAHIHENGRRKHLGVFDTAEEAHAAYVARAKIIFREFASSGF